MFATVDIGGKQYTVSVGDVIEVDRREGAAGDTLVFERVLLVGKDGDTVQVGDPVVKGIQVTTKLLEQKKGEKIDVRRYKAKVRYRKQRGFRHQLTRLEIVSIG